jgi:hypothetical protein
MNGSQEYLMLEDVRNANHTTSIDPRREKRLAYKRKYRQEHNDKIKEYSKKYYLINKEKINRDDKEYYKIHREKLLSYAKDYNLKTFHSRKDKRSEILKNYRLKNKPTYEQNKRYRLKYKEKVRARKILKRRIEQGEILKPLLCSSCGKCTTLHGHHHDYSKPVDVVWLCLECHSKIHWKINHD